METGLANRFQPTRNPWTLEATTERVQEGPLSSLKRILGSGLVRGAGNADKIVAVARRIHGIAHGFGRSYFCSG